MLPGSYLVIVPFRKSATWPAPWNENPLRKVHPPWTDTELPGVKLTMDEKLTVPVKVLLPFGLKGNSILFLPMSHPIQLKNGGYQGNG